MRALEHTLSWTPLRPRLNAIMTRWHWLIEIVSDPYRPELHYMRGPGPKWRAKHQGHTESSAPWRRAVKSADS
jgi:hypothetical protein